MANFKELQTEYNEMIKASITEVNRIIKEELPMESGYGFKVKTHPMPTIEQAERAKQLIEDLRGNASRKREEIQKLHNMEVEEKIKELGDLIGSKDWSKKKTTDAKWVILAREQSRLSETLTASNFWKESHNIVIVIAKWISERSAYEHLKKKETERNAEKLWCKQYLVEKTGLTQELLNTMSEPTIIELAHNHMKIEYAKANELTGEKCYCDAHDECRHYHFADTYWDGKQVIVFESSETY